MRSGSSRALAFATFALLVLLPASPALAHSVNKRFGDFYGGMLHPLTALEHLLAIIALSLLAGQQGPRTARWTLLALPAGLLAGATAAAYGPPLAAVHWINLASLVVLGLLVAAAVRLPLAGLVALALACGLTHGYGNATDLTSEIARYLFVPGVVAAGLGLLAVGAAVVVSLRRPWQKIAVRVGGSWIAAAGLLVLAVQ